MLGTIYEASSCSVSSSISIWAGLIAGRGERFYCGRDRFIQRVGLTIKGDSHHTAAGADGRIIAASGIDRVRHVITANTMALDGQSETVSLHDDLAPGRFRSEHTC